MRKGVGKWMNGRGEGGNERSRRPINGDNPDLESYHLKVPEETTAKIVHKSVSAPHTALCNYS